MGPVSELDNDPKGSQEGAYQPLVNAGVQLQKQWRHKIGQLLG